jgi:hypothetical protein
MPEGPKAYIVAVLRQLPLSWRRGSFMTGLIVSIVTIALLVLGWRLDSISGVVMACSVGAITAFDILILFPYQLWKANVAEIKALKKRLAPRLRFLPKVRQEGEGGHYTAYVTVRNLSRAEKMRECRCEIVELKDAFGSIVERNIGLRTRGQQAQELGGRFNLDQQSEKDVPLFEVNQLEEPVGGFCVIAAGNKNIRLEYGGTYLALVRGYGDSGEPDEIVVRADSRAVTFEAVPGERSPKA